VRTCHRVELLFLCVVHRFTQVHSKGTPKKLLSQVGFDLTVYVLSLIAQRCCPPVRIGFPQDVGSGRIAGPEARAAGLRPQGIACGRGCVLC
jgi:hypothetical protein